jgi:hypothetical protein
MSKRNKPSDNTHGPFIYGFIFHSKAYRSLKTKHAHLIYNILRSFLKDKKLKKVERKARADAMGKPGKRSPHPNSDLINKENWNNLTLSYRWLMDYWNLKNARTIKAAFDELHEVGLIDILHVGGGSEGDQSIYAMSERWRRYGERDFKWPVLEPDPKTGRIGYCYEAKGQPDKVIPWPVDKVSTDNPSHKRLKKRQLIK